MYSAKQQKLEEFERKKRGRELCYDSAIADFRTPGTKNELVIWVRKSFGSMTRFIACLNKRLNKNVIDNIVNGTRKLRDLKDLVCTPSLTEKDLAEHEIDFCSCLKDYYKNDKMSENWMEFIRALYYNITMCAKDSPDLQTRPIDSVEELISMYKEWLPTRSSTRSPTRSSTRSPPTSKKKGGKSKRVKRSKTCKNRVHKRRN
jgi:hypothetical protein